MKITYKYLFFINSLTIFCYCINNTNFKQQDSIIEKMYNYENFDNGLIGLNENILPHGKDSFILMIGGADSIVKCVYEPDIPSLSGKYREKVYWHNCVFGVNEQNKVTPLFIDFRYSKIFYQTKLIRLDSSTTLGAVSSTLHYSSVLSRGGGEKWNGYVQLIYNTAELKQKKTFLYIRDNKIQYLSFIEII